eukprot:TRINITY_DN105_c0_g2_i1.p1 TRINITY_DN105_c0_g2~~TRINITY_DN105_c0_g2_i1.p1  ORF type:complete len:347 (-),score=94.19 TRINITY_DN105_c0_g2_i1:11-1051(-)
MAKQAELLVGGSINTAHVHPVVLLGIVDHYSRRNEGQTRVIGTLLGVVRDDGVVEVRNCFPVPHTEGEQVGVDVDFHHTMYDLQQKVNPNEIVVGWYASGSEITENSVLFNEFYEREIQGSAVHLLVDPTLQRDDMKTQAYVSANLTFADDEEPHAAQFQPINFVVRSFNGDNTAIALAAKKNTAGECAYPLVSDLGCLEENLKRLTDDVDLLSSYVEDVLAGKVAPDTEVGSQLYEVLSALPALDGATFDKLLNSNIQDLLMVCYLSSMTRSQLTLAEDLTKGIKTQQLATGDEENDGTNNNNNNSNYRGDRSGGRRDGGRRDGGGGGRGGGGGGGGRRNDNRRR